MKAYSFGYEYNGSYTPFLHQGAPLTHAQEERTHIHAQTHAHARGGEPNRREGTSISYRGAPQIS